MQPRSSEHARHEIWRHVRYADGPMFNHVSLLRAGHVLSQVGGFLPTLGGDRCCQPLASFTRVSLSSITGQAKAVLSFQGNGERFGKSQEDRLVRQSDSSSLLHVTRAFNHLHRCFNHAHVGFLLQKVLFTMCAGNELWFSMMYLLHFTEGPAGASSKAHLVFAIRMFFDV